MDHTPRRRFALRVALLPLIVCTPVRAESPSPAPSAKGLEEKVQVRLLQVDAIVLDKDGRTVPDLQKTDFTLKIGGTRLEVNTVDLLCPIGAAAEPPPLAGTGATAPAPIGPGVKRRVVFAFDYSFLDVTMRAQVLDAAAAMLRLAKTDEEEVMIVALAGQVRIEQKFTQNLGQLVGALSRMKHDVTLWGREFPIGSTGRGYFADLSTLMDVLGSYDGAKAVVLFSQANRVGTTMQDAFFNDVAAHAAAGRAAIYPAEPNMISSARAGETLTRLANQTGGRMRYLGNDISQPYRSAQRDLSCRYTLGSYVDPAAAHDPRALSVSLARPGLSVRAPEMAQLFSEEERRKARAAAAYVDPGPFERPLVRAFAFPALPADAKKWQTLLAVNFPAPVGPAGADIDVRAVVRQKGQAGGEYKQRLHVDPAPGGAASRPVTVVGSPKLGAGDYDLTIVLSDAAGGEIVSAQTDFSVPEVVQDSPILRGPILGRVVAGGEFLRANPKDRPEDTRLGKILGPGNGFEPLLVGECDPKDTLLFYWSACVSGKNPLPADAVVARSFVNSAGQVAKALDPVPLKLESRGKGVSCLDMLETLPGNSLASGDYRLDVSIAHPNGDVVAGGSRLLTVR